MQQALSFLLLACLALSVVAAPLTPRNALAKRNHFKVSVRGRPKLSPVQAINAAYRKYGWEQMVVNPAPTSNAIADSQPPESNESESSSDARSGGSPTSSGSPPGGADEGDVTATLSDQDSEYLSTVTIGGQQLNLQLDTGSADLWVYTPALRKQGGGSFDSSKSSTWSTYKDASWSTQYGDLTGASGSVGFDTVEIGGVVAEKQCVELATQASTKLIQDTYSDGILGLGFTALNQVSPQPQKTFFENVQGDLEQPVFTADLTDDSSGEYEFGTIDSSKYTGDIHYTAVNNKLGYWQIESPTYEIDGKTRQCQTCSPAVVDTGTTLILVDSDVAKAYYAQVQGSKYESEQGGYVYACGTELPDFGVAIGQYTATIKGSHLTYAPVEEGSSSCYGGIQPGPGHLQIYGDVLLRSAFVVFDIGKIQVGFAQKA